jgi:CRP-like cAMP-binding protein
LSTENNLTTIEKIIFLKSVDIFEHATIEQLGRIAGLTEEARFESGQTIFKEGDPGDALYLVLSGRVLIEKNDVTIREVRALKLDGRQFHDLLALDIEMVESVLRMLCGHIRKILTLVS